MSWHDRRSFRLAIVLIAIAAIVMALAGLGLYRARSLQLAMKEWRRQGVTAVDAGRYDEAIPLLDRYISRKPDDPAVLYAMAIAVAASDSSSRGQARARQMLQRTLQLDQTHGSAARLLLRLESIDRDPQALLVAADHVLRLSPDSMDAIAARARALAAVDKPEAALATVEQLIAERPLDFEAHLLSLELLDRLGRPGDELLAHGRQLIEQHPDEAVSHAVMAAAAAAVGESELALEQARLAAQASPTQPQVLQRVADLLDRYGDPQAGMLMLQRSIENATAANKPEVGVLNALARRLWQRQRWQELADLSATRNAWQTSDADARAGDVDVKAGRSVARADRARAWTEVNALLAWAALEVGKPELAESLMTDLATEPSAISRAWHMLLRQRREPGAVNGHVVLESVRAALLADASSPPLLLLAGNVASAQGFTRAALDYWDLAAEQAPAWPQPLVRATQLLASEGRSSEALTTIRIAMTRRPDDMTAVAAAAETWWSTLGWQPGESDRQLLAFIEQLRTDAPELDRVWPLHIALLLRLDGRPAAQAALNQMLSQPMSERTALQLAELARRADLEGGEGLLKRRLEEQEPTPALVFGYLAASEVSTDEGLAMIDQLDDGRLAWRIVKAAYLERIGESQQAIKTWRELIKEHGEKPAVLQAALQMPVVMYQKQWADELITRLREATSENAVGWREARVRWLLREDDQESAARAASLLNQLVAVDPHNAEYRLLFADALMRLGDLDRAEAQLVEATALRPRSIPVLLSRAAVAIERKDQNVARGALDRVLRIGGLNDAQRRQAANLLAAVGWRERAQILLSESGSDMGLSAVLKLQAGDIEGAWALIEPLLQQEPTPQLLLLGARVALLRGESEVAGDLLGQLESLGIDRFEAARLEAQLYDDLGMVDAATKAYARAAASATNAGQKALVHQAWLAMLVRTRQTDRVQAWLAEREMPQAMTDASITAADLVAASSDEASARLAAEALVNSEQAATLWNAMRLLLAARDHGDRDEATVARLVRLAKATPDSQVLVLVVARFALATGDTASANELASGAAIRFPRSVEAAALETAALVQGERWSLVPGAAQRWRSRLSAVDPYEPDLAEAVAEAELGRTSHAMTLIEPHAQAGRPEAVMLMVRLLAAKDRLADAFAYLEPRLEEGVSWRGEWRRLAVGLPDHEMAADRLTRLDRLLSESMPGEIVEHAATWAALAGRSQVVAHREHAIRLLDQAGELALSDVSEGWYRLGRAYDRLGKISEAEFAYRQAIEQDPNSVKVLNDLAMLLLSLESGDEAAALALAERAVKLKDAGPWVWDTLALARERAGDVQGAVEAARQAVVMSPNDPQWLVALAERQLAAGQREAAGDSLATLQRRFQVIDPGLRSRVEALVDAFK